MPAVCKWVGVDAESADEDVKDDDNKGSPAMAEVVAKVREAAGTRWLFAGRGGGGGGGGGGGIVGGGNK